MKRHTIALIFFIILGTSQIPAVSAKGDEGWQAGAAKVSITPKEPMWMAGYAARNHPSEGVEHDLWAKALVLRDPDGNQAVLVTLDVCGIDRALSLDIRATIEELGFAKDKIVLACSHTHSGPVLGRNLITMYPLDDEQQGRVERYTKFLHDAVIEAVRKATDAAKPAELSHDIGRCSTFAFNRRDNDQGRVPELRETLAVVGPDDHDVPVLRVRDPKGAIQAVVFGFACHCTTLSYYKFCGDYAGFAQIEVEKANPGAIALFWAGCGADQNPLPRGTVEQAQRYGEDLATSVQEVLARPMKPLAGPLRSAYHEVDLAFAPLPTREEWESRAKSDNRYEAARAKALLVLMEKEGGLRPSYPYPIQIWKFGDKLTWVFLGGEVVVDYAHRIKRNLGSDSTWVAAYCNDVMAYIPSLRVLKEGGYEGGGAMVYYAQPGPWSDKVEEQIVEKTVELLRLLRR